MRYLIIFTFILLMFGCDSSTKDEFNEFYDSGELKIKGQIQNGDREGEWHIYSKEGELTQKLYYDNDSLNYRETFIDGNLAIIEELQDSVRNGKLKLFYEDGTVKAVTTYRNGVERGASSSYYPNGHKRTEFIIEDKKILDYKQYYKTGTLHFETEDYNNGETIFYDSSGRKSMIVIFKDREAVDTLQVY